MTQTRAEWQAEQDERNRRTGSWGFDPGMPWHVANWLERLGIVFFHGIMWGGVFPAMLIGGVLLFGTVMDGVSRYKSEHDRCLKNATNGYDIERIP